MPGMGPVIVVIPFCFHLVSFPVWTIALRALLCMVQCCCVMSGDQLKGFPSSPPLCDIFLFVPSQSPSLVRSGCRLRFTGLGGRWSCTCRSASLAAAILFFAH
eukprot:GGOE01046872.1.p1 GENE.GGOE01046872.1~~GGOE01046872.1.p1  ORF type:complete len:103 (+),score=0.02 GGOE01046872.1:70-378(+)